MWPLAGLAPLQAQDAIGFLSTQLSPPKEAHAMRNAVLSGFGRAVEFFPLDDTGLFMQLATGDGTAQVRPSLLGALHGEMVALDRLGTLSDLQALLPRDMPGMPKSFAEFGRAEDGRRYYLPWLQASYIMVANREALAYLPAGADLDRLSYDQLGAWAEAMRRGTGRSKVGFPVAERGLMHRFIQGYLYPSFTGGMVTTFKSDEAVAMWQWMRAFWPSVDPLSLTYSNMSEPLINDEVWVGWDHSARMLPVFRARPDDFVAFPAPIGPKGRGFLVVVVGLGVPVGAEDAEGGAQLMSYLLQPSVQVATLQATGFFPVVGGGDRSGLPPALGNMARAIDLQAGSDGALPAFLPVGLKALSDEFNIRYSLAFSQIVLRDQDIREALERQGSGLASLLVEAGAPCWRPDPPSAGHCRLR